MTHDASEKASVGGILMSLNFFYDFEVALENIRSSETTIENKNPLFYQKNQSRLRGLLS